MPSTILSDGLFNPHPPSLNGGTRFEPGMIVEELGVLHRCLGQLHPQLLAGVQQAPAEHLGG